MKLEIKDVEKTVRKCSTKKAFLKIMRNSQENISVEAFFFFFFKFSDPQHKTFLKKRDPDMAFSREFYAKISLTSFL